MKRSAFVSGICSVVKVDKRPSNLCQLTSSEHGLACTFFLPHFVSFPAPPSLPPMEVDDGERVMTTLGECSSKCDWFLHLLAFPEEEFGKGNVVKIEGRNGGKERGGRKRRWEKLEEGRNVYVTDDIKEIT